MCAGPWRFPRAIPRMSFITGYSTRHSHDPLTLASYSGELGAGVVA
jgi:hypothetical protein